MDDTNKGERPATPQELRAFGAGWEVDGAGAMKPIWRNGPGDLLASQIVIANGMVYGPDDRELAVPHLTNEQRLERALDLWDVPPPVLDLETEQRLARELGMVRSDAHGPGWRDPKRQGDLIVVYQGLAGDAWWRWLSADVDEAEHPNEAAALHAYRTSLVNVHAAPPSAPGASQGCIPVSGTVLPATERTDRPPVTQRVAIQFTRTVPEPGMEFADVVNEDGKSIRCGTWATTDEGTDLLWLDVLASNVRGPARAWLPGDRRPNPKPEPVPVDGLLALDIALGTGWRILDDNARHQTVLLHEASGMWTELSPSALEGVPPDDINALASELCEAVAIGRSGRVSIEVTRRY